MWLFLIFALLFAGSSYAFPGNSKFVLAKLSPYLAV